jgi:glycosyltransferase involved in cell wall biosynthesis
MATTYIYEEQWPEFTRNKTGFGMMVREVYQSISEEEEVYLISHVLTAGHEKSVLKHTISDVLLSAKLSDWRQGILWACKFNQPIKGRIQYFYYCLNKGFVRKTIKTMKPDIVHIHGLSQSTKTYMEVCEELHVPYVVTLHGLIGLNDTVTATSWDKIYENLFLLKADQEDIPVTVISTGMKKRIEDNYLHHEAKNISVITNGTKIPFNSIQSNGKLNLRDKFGLPKDCKIGVVIGSICERKNQMQVIEAIATLPEKTKNRCVIFLCGTDCMNGKIQKHIEMYQLQKNVIVLGFLSREILSQVLDQADFNIVASKDEGFGVSIIEAYSHGLPTVTFKDLDAIMDLFDEKTMVLASERSSKSLASSIERLLESSWDEEYIKDFSTQFSLEKMAEKYESEYYAIINRGGITPLELTYDYIRIQKLFGKKILVYIGNISDNKNQIQALRVMKKLDNAVLIILGRECDGDKVRNYVIENNLFEKVVLAGFCDDVDQVWLDADLNLFLSKNDGFGLSVIEGLMRGVPSVMFDDLDAFADVKNATGVNVLRQRDDNYVVQRISEAVACEWNTVAIENTAMQYSKENMAEQYLKVLRN